MAWQQHFVTNMFIRPETKEDIENFEPDFTIINACSQVDEDWEKHGLNSEVAVVFNIEKKCAVIFGKLLTRLGLRSLYFFKYEYFSNIFARVNKKERGTVAKIRQVRIAYNIVNVSF